MGTHFFSHFFEATGGSQGYSMYEIINLTVGILIWTYLYAYLAYRGFKVKFVQMPLILACGNIAWEFLWGFVFQSNYHIGVMASMGTACLIDLTICYGILKFNAKYFTVEYYAKNIRWLMAFGIGLWILVWWAFRQAGMDTDAGAASGNILNILIALLWVNMVFTLKDFSKLSSRLGWLKLLGDIPLTLFVMVRFPDNDFVIVSGWLSVLFDAIYVVVFYWRKHGGGPFKPLAQA